MVLFLTLPSNSHMDSMPIKLFDPPDQPYHPLNLQFSYRSFGKTTVTHSSCQSSAALHTQCTYTYIYIYIYIYVCRSTE